MAANAPDARLRVRNPVPGPRGGGLYLSESQRTRLLGAAFAIVCEEGYRGMAVRAVAERAGVSSKTFYDLFEDREGCFLAAFDDGVERLREVARPAYEVEGDWVAGIRGGLAALLAFLDREPALCRLVLVEALGVGPRVLARRAEVLDGLGSLVDRGREGAKTADELPPMAAAGVVGAAFSVVHARLIERDAGPVRDAESERDAEFVRGVELEPLVGLLNELMATIVLPYRGREAATRELSEPAPKLPAQAALPEARGPEERSAARAVSVGDFRLTVRRQAVLSAVVELCGEGVEPCNREVSERIALEDQSQVSRLMMGLQRQGLVENTRAGVLGTRKAWRVTPQGRAVLDANPPLEPQQRPGRKGASVTGGSVNRGLMNGIAATRASANRRPSTQVGVGRSRRRGGGRPVAERQRGRLLEATFAVVAEEGYRELTVAKVAERAGVSRRTFYESFSDRDDCFLQAFDYALDVLAERVLPAYEAEREWADRVRAGLAALLESLDGEPALRRLLFVEALAAGPQVLARRTQVLDELTAVVEEGRKGEGAPEVVPALAAEATVGAAFGVIYGQLSQRRPGPLVGLLGSLMATIVLPYRGSADAARELERAMPQPGAGAQQSTGSASGRPLGSTLPADFRLTVRTQMALAAIAESSARGMSPSNLEVAGRIGVSGKSTVSKLMSRLREQGLVENTRGNTKGLEKAWRLTGDGEAVLDAHRPSPFVNTDDPADISGGKLVAKRGPRPVPARPASAGFRLTARTQLVLTAVAEHAGASNRKIAKAAGVRDEGQISKLLARLRDRGLIRDTANPTSSGYAKAWQLTPQGEALIHTNRQPAGSAA
jgi:AcrR family transcriptional regulator/DNA-binding MarR family transcriptional regulator